MIDFGQLIFLVAIVAAVAIAGFCAGYMLGLTTEVDDD